MSAPIVARTRAELAVARAKLDGSVGVVMTMGALHEGHDVLIRAARARAEHVVVTIFVNPLQFGPNEDFDRYPRTFEADLARCESLSVDVVFAPAVEEMYPGGTPQVRLNPGVRGEILEGASRPGFFHGVLTVVMKLLQLTRPDFTFFGEKDYQQLALVRQMARDLDVPVEVVGVPTDRDPDGLARSSRNRYLSPAGREAALALSRSLRAGAKAASAGVGPAATLAAAIDEFTRTAKAASECLELDYLVLTAPDLGDAPEIGAARLIAAAWIGRDTVAGVPGTRLIDNGPVELV
jgi:pantoate--beta-alanine ligase